MKVAHEIHQDFEAFKVSTHEIGSKSLKFREPISADALKCLLYEEQRPDFSWYTNQIIAPQFLLEQENAQSYRIKCKAEIVLINACVRCLEPVEHLIGLDFSLRMMEELSGSSQKVNTESTWAFESESLAQGSESDYTVGYFSKRQIDLAQVLREQIFLALPDYPQCGRGFAVKKVECETLIPLANAEDSPKDSRRPFVNLFAKANLK